MNLDAFIASLLAPIDYPAYRITSLILIILMFVAALAAIVLVMFTPGNSQGIDALSGSSETFYGKNKGKSTESLLKRLTVACLVVLAVLAVVFFIISIESLWA